MSLKDIEKLKERVEKDPNTKLFVPLAEEYRKEGMVEEAIKVLLDGIEKQPGYMSARVALGKIYLEKGMSTEARDEFENVIKAIPDNLYAHKKLAEIYKDNGLKDLAIKSYRTVLKLNAMDEDASINLHDLEEGGAMSEDTPVDAPALDKEPLGVEEAVAEGEADEYAFTDSSYEEPDDALAVPSEDEFSAFKDSLFGEKAEEAGPEPLALAEEIAETGEESLDMWGSAPGVGDQAAPSDMNVPPGKEDPGDENASKKSLAEKIAEAMKREEMPARTITPEPVMAAAATYMPEQAAKSNAGKTIADADGLVSEGNYAAAISAYNSILSRDPGDRKVMQRMEELKSLLKMTGKDKEVLISRLNAFLDGVKKGRDGFHRSS